MASPGAPPTMTTTESHEESALQNFLLELQGRIDSAKQILESEPLNVVAAIEILKKGNGMSEIEVALYTFEQEGPDNLEFRLYVVMAMMYFHKFIFGRQIPDLEESKICWMEATTHKPLDACLDLLFAYAIYLNRVFQHTGCRAYKDGATAIAVILAAHTCAPEFGDFLDCLTDRQAREAGEISPPEDRNRKRYKLDNLALAFTSSYSEVGKLSDSLVLLKDYLTSAGPTFLSTNLYVLGNMLMHRYELSKPFAGSTEMLISTSMSEEAIDSIIVGVATAKISVSEFAAECFGCADKQSAELLCSQFFGPEYFLGNTITASQIDIDDAIESFERELAVEASMELRAETLYSLSKTLAVRHRDFGDSESKTRAIRFATMALELPRAPPKIRYGAGMIAAKYAVDDKDWNTATNLYTKIVGIGGDEHTGVEKSMELTAETFLNLSKTLAVRHRDFGDSESKSRALRYARMALTNPRASPKIRYEAGMIAAKYAEDDNDWNAAAHLYTASVGLIPTVISRSSGRADYDEHILRKAYGSSPAAAATILQARGTAGQALEVLEASRGLTASQLICSRNDVSDLALKYPEKFEEYDMLRSNIVRDEERLSSLEAEIRNLPGFSSFLKAMDERDLLLQCRDSHIVYLNVSPIRSDAICVSATEIQDISLPNLKFDELISWAQFLTGKQKKTKLIPEDFVERNQDICKLLKWLWKIVIKPVLGGLNLLQESYLGTQNLPHIIWIPTGPLTVFPLHAAGIHDEGSIENTLSQVVSSYTSTIRSLVYAREFPEIKYDEPLSVLSPQHKKALVVTMTKTSNYQGMSYGQLDVYDEVKALQMAFGETVILERPSTFRVLKELETTDVVHFACHGFVDAKNPSNSALLLHDNYSDVASPLTIKDLVQIAHLQARIAYLSACSTAETSTIEIAEESIHLASTFQLVGFEHVIGTLWEAEDSASTAVAEEFYHTMNRQAGQDDSHRHHVARALHGFRALCRIRKTRGVAQAAQDDSHRHHVARALHEAVLRYREMEREFPISWAPFVHFGE